MVKANGQGSLSKIAEAGKTVKSLLLGIIFYGWYRCHHLFAPSNFHRVTYVEKLAELFEAEVCFTLAQYVFRTPWGWEVLEKKLVMQNWASLDVPCTRQKSDTQKGQDKAYGGKLRTPERYSLVKFDRWESSSGHLTCGLFSLLAWMGCITTRDI